MSQILENPRGGCVLAGINSVLGAIDRVCPVYHAGPGCCMQTTASDQGQSGHKSACFVSGVSLPSSNMLEKEVVFGGVNKLITTIQGAVDIIDADAYFILTGCTAGIIGDDIVSVTEEFKAKGHPVYPIETPGFVGDSNLG
jgi:Nitrogenase molybdenum-iron protein, alpha and beta chains